jgi:hypothetical protein
MAGNVLARGGVLSVELVVRDHRHLVTRISRGGVGIIMNSFRTPVESAV